MPSQVPPDAAITQQSSGQMDHPTPPRPLPSPALVDSPPPEPPAGAEQAAAALGPGSGLFPPFSPSPPPPPPRDSLASTPPGGRPPWSPIVPATAEVKGLHSLREVALAVQELQARMGHAETGLERVDRWRLRKDQEMSQVTANHQDFQSQMSESMLVANRQFAGMWSSVHSLGQSFADIEASIKKETKATVQEATEKQTLIFRQELDKRTGPWVLLKASIPVVLLLVAQFLVAYLRK